MRLKEIQNTFHNVLDSVYGEEEVNSFFFMLIEHFFNISRLKLAMEPNYVIDDSKAIMSALEALKNEKPIQYIIGETEFYGLPFKVNKNVLIPRPETEELVEWIVSEFSIQSSGFRIQHSEFRILDVGTGSGCIAISLAKNLPNVKIYALDISKEALNVAKQNAEINRVDVEFFEVDILEVEGEKGKGKRDKGKGIREKGKGNSFENLKFDIIVSNPPYVRALEKQQMKHNVLNNEPHLALFVDDENPLLFYNAISDFATNTLKNNGALFFEINEYLGSDMIKLLKEKAFKNIELRQDLFKKDRMVKGRLI